MRATLLAAGVLTIALTARVNATIVSGCGQTFDGNAELADDLDCSGYAGTTLTLTKGSLRLHGFTLTGHPDHTVVHCERGCKVSGPGTLTGGKNGVEGVSPVRVYDATVTGNTGLGITGKIVRLLRSSVTENGSPNGSELVFSGGAHAVTRLVVVRSLIQDNLNFGTHAATTTIGRGTTIIDNGVNADCAAAPYAISLGCADLAVSNWRRPPVVLSGSLCGRSQRLYQDLGLNWGACADD